MRTQYEPCIMSPFWHLEFWGGSKIFGKFVHPGIINTNNTLKLFNLYNELQMFLLKFFFFTEMEFHSKRQKKKSTILWHTKFLLQKKKLTRTIDFNVFHIPCMTLLHYIIIQK